MPSWRREGRRQAGRGAQGSGSCSDPGREGGCFPQNPLPPKKSSGESPSSTRSPQSPGVPLARAGWGAPGVVLLQGEGVLGHGEGPPLVPARGTASSATRNAKRSPRSSSPPPQEPVPIAQAVAQCHAMLTATGLLGSTRRCPGNSFPLCFSPSGTTTGGQTSKKGKKGRGHGYQLQRPGFFFPAAALAAQHQQCLVPTHGSLRTHNKTSAAIHMTGRKRTHTDARLQETSFAHSGVPRCERKPKHSWGEEERRIYLNEHTLLRSCLRFPSPSREAVCISPLPATN